MVERLEHLDGRSATVADAVRVVREAHEAGWLNFISQRPEESLKAAAAIVVDDTAIRRLSELFQQLAARPSQGDALRRLLTSDPAKAVEVLHNGAPANADLLPELFALRTNEALKNDVWYAIEAFREAALPQLRAALASENVDDVRRAGLCLKELGRMSAPAVDDMMQALRNLRGRVEENDCYARDSVLTALAAAGAYLMDSKVTSRDIICMIAGAMSRGEQLLGTILAGPSGASYVRDVINGMGPSAWAELPALIAADPEVWSGLSHVVGNAPDSAAAELVKLLRAGKINDAMLDALSTSSRERRREASEELMARGTWVTSPKAMRFIASEAAEGGDAERNKTLVDFFAPAVGSSDAQKAKAAFESLLPLWPDAERVTQLRNALANPLLQRNALMALRKAPGKADVPAVSPELESIAASDKSLLWSRVRCWELLGYSDAHIAVHGLKQVTTSKVADDAAEMYTIARKLGDDRRVECLTTMLGAELDQVRGRAASWIMDLLKDDKVGRDDPSVAKAIEVATAWPGDEQARHALVTLKLWERRH